MTIPEPRGPVVPPVDMSPAEKLAAEWEARHDVLARGHRADPLVLQHYLAHARTEEVVRCSDSRRSRPTGATAVSRKTAASGEPAPPRDPATPAPADTSATGGEPIPAGVRHAPWWRRFRRH